MLKFLAVLGEWLLKNSVQKVIAGAGLSVVGYVGILVAVRAAFNTMIGDLNSIPATLLQMMGICRIDHFIGSFVSVALFLLTLNSGKLMIRKKQ
ncbi:DUF2523 family protein [Acinetobacter sp. WU_MDCI_Abxb74]|uniref:DUF2523 family protein n=1 Tax=Acinetobacter sp. WU_MDCI_Abxb74 TaxID=2850072 RepID=UPI0021CD39F8|nr:DUF2523 family protein [Acinetobacter sp. WU_MDCI_Abxb74]MCU4423309.1 DUF2523 domain-containing protein [Acinetobacter sp. WU_MDCI_Abxb74]